MLKVNQRIYIYLKGVSHFTSPLLAGTSKADLKVDQVIWSLVSLTDLCRFFLSYTPIHVPHQIVEYFDLKQFKGVKHTSCQSWNRFAVCSQSWNRYAVCSSLLSTRHDIPLTGKKADLWRTLNTFAKKKLPALLG